MGFSLIALVGLFLIALVVIMIVTLLSGGSGSIKCSRVWNGAKEPEPLPPVPITAEGLRNVVDEVRASSGKVCAYVTSPDDQHCVSIEWISEDKMWFLMTPPQDQVDVAVNILNQAGINDFKINTVNQYLGKLEFRSINATMPVPDDAMLVQLVTACVGGNLCRISVELTDQKIARKTKPDQTP